MPEERLVREIEAIVFSHATEDEGKVKSAIKNVLPGIDLIFEETQVTGHYNDPIIVISAKITKRKDASNTFENLFTRLNSVDKSDLLEEIDNHLDQSGNLYLRLDKQKAYNGKIILQEIDPIKMKLKFLIPHRADMVSVVREYLLNLDEVGAE